MSAAADDKVEAEPQDQPHSGEDTVQSKYRSFHLKPEKRKAVRAIVKSHEMSIG
jgi:hypothetical protein